MRTSLLLFISAGFLIGLTNTVSAAQAVLSSDEFNVDVANTELLLSGTTTVADLAPNETLSCDTSTNRLDIRTSNDLAAAMIAKASRLSIKIDFNFTPGAPPSFPCDIDGFILGNDGED